jgi:hypothetical protein
MRESRNGSSHYHSEGDAGVENNVSNESEDDKIEEDNNLKHAIELRKEKNKHSDFFLLLSTLNERIQTYK